MTECRRVRKPADGAHSAAHQLHLHPHARCAPCLLPSHHTLQSSHLLQPAPPFHFLQLMSSAGLGYKGAALATTVLYVLRMTFLLLWIRFTTVSAP